MKTTKLSMVWLILLLITACGAVNKPIVHTNLYNTSTQVICAVNATGNGSEFYVGAYLANASYDLSNYEEVDWGSSYTSAYWNDNLTTSMTNCSWYKCYVYAYYLTEYEANFATQTANTSCATPPTTTTSTTPQGTTMTFINDNVTYTSLWGLSDGGNMNGSTGVGLGNTTGLGTILGLGKTNFFILVSLITTTLVIISLSRVSIKFGMLMGIASLDIFIQILKWVDMTFSLFFIINLFALLIFISGGRR